MSNPLDRHECRERLRKGEMACRRVSPEAFSIIYQDSGSNEDTRHPADIRRENKKLAELANQLNDRVNAEKRDFSEFEDLTWTAIQAMITLNNMEIALQADVDQHFRGSLSPGATEGKKIYAKGENLALQYRPENLHGVHLGHVMRAMATGAGYNQNIQNALSEGTDSASGYTTPIEILREFIDRVRSKSVLFNAGAKAAILEAKKSNIATVATDPVAGWRAENAPVTESDLVLGNVAFTPKSLAVLVKVSRELLQDSINVEEILLNSLAQGLALQLDFAGLYGSGASNQPLGLDSILTTASQVTTLAANGAKLSASGYYREIAKAMAQVAGNNDQATAIILSPRTKYDLGWMADSTNQPLRAPAIVAENFQVLDTTSVPNNLVVGASAAVCSEAFIGNFESLMLGLRQELRIEILPQTFAGNLQVGYIAHLRADWQPTRIGSFWKLKGILAE